MKPGYLIAELDINDENMFFNEYMPRVGPVIEQFGGRFIIAADYPQVMEGDRKVRRIIMLEFESVQRAHEFYASREYQEVSSLRYKSALTHLYIMEGR
jgi:uncharacterized protein (DUF1330 family)